MHRGTGSIHFYSNNRITGLRISFFFCFFLHNTLTVFRSIFQNRIAKTQLHALFTRTGNNIFIALGMILEDYTRGYF